MTRLILFYLVNLEFYNPLVQTKNVKFSKITLSFQHYQSEGLLRRFASSFFSKTRDEFYKNVNILLKDPANDVFEMSKRNVNGSLNHFRNASFSSLQGRLILIDLKINKLMKKLRNEGIEYDARKPITMRTRHMHSILTKNDDALYGLDKHAHGLSNQQFIRALKAINNPLFISVDLEKLYVFTDVTDYNENNIVCAFKLDKNTRELRLLSVYGKTLTADYFINKKVIYMCSKIKRAIDATPPNAGRFTNALYGYMLKLKSTKVNERH